MIKRIPALYLLVLNFILIGCAAPPASKPIVLEEAENDIHAGIKAYEESNWWMAQRSFNRALSIYQGIDDQLGILNTSINLAEVALSQRHYQASHIHLARAAKIIRQNALAPYQPRIMLLKVQIALLQKRVEQAERQVRPLLPSFNNITPTTIPDTIQMSAIACRTQIAIMQKKDDVLWVHRYDEALRLSAIKNDGLKARLLRFQAALKQNQRDYVAAEPYLLKALGLYKRKQHRTGIAATLFELAQLSMRQEQWQNAGDYFLRSISVYGSIGDAEKIAQVNEILEKVKLELCRQSVQCVSPAGLQ